GGGAEGGAGSGVVRGDGGVVDDVAGGIFDDSCEAPCDILGERGPCEEKDGGENETLHLEPPSSGSPTDGGRDINYIPVANRRDDRLHDSCTVRGGRSIGEAIEESMGRAAPDVFEIDDGVRNRRNGRAAGAEADAEQLAAGFDRVVAPDGHGPDGVEAGAAGID